MAASSALALALATVLLCMLAGTQAAHDRVPRPICSSKSCKACTSPSSCLSCRTGYWRTKSAVCRPCPIGCSRCIGLINRPYCTACKPAFRRKEGACVRRAIAQACSIAKWKDGAWTNVFGRNSAGKCVQCFLTGFNVGWCKACDGDFPTACTKCSNPSKPQSLLKVDKYGECQVSNNLDNNDPEPMVG